jgi:hypothetical protein
MSDDRIQTHPTDQRERKDRYAVYAGRLAAAIWSSVAAMIAGLLLLAKLFPEHFDMMTSWPLSGIFLLIFVIPGVTIVTALGIAALIFGIRGWSRDRIVAPGDFDSARFGVVTGILTTLCFVFVLCYAVWDPFSPTPVPNTSTSKPTSTNYK